MMNCPSWGRLRFRASSMDFAELTSAPLRFACAVLTAVILASARACAPLRYRVSASLPSSLSLSSFLRRLTSSVPGDSAFLASASAVSAFVLACCAFSTAFGSASGSFCSVSRSLEAAVTALFSSVSQAFFIPAARDSAALTANCFVSSSLR